MADLIKRVGDLPLGTAYAAELENVDCDIRIKKSIYRLANDLHETSKRLNDAIEVIMAFNDALQMLGESYGKLEARARFSKHE